VLLGFHAWPSFAPSVLCRASFSLSETPRRNRAVIQESPEPLLRCDVSLVILISSRSTCLSLSSVSLSSSSQSDPGESGSILFLRPPIAFVSRPAHCFLSLCVTNCGWDFAVGGFPLTARPHLQSAL
jgi:hypothetical protein